MYNLAMTAPSTVSLVRVPVTFTTHKRSIAQRGLRMESTCMIPKDGSYVSRIIKSARYSSLKVNPFSKKVQIGRNFSLNFTLRDYGCTLDSVITPRLLLMPISMVSSVSLILPNR
jgi:hypothetical protein